MDCAYGTALLLLPLLFNWGPGARRLACSAGAATLISTLLTNYEYGLLPVLSMKSHLALDATQTSVLLSAPARLGPDERRAASVLAAFGAAGAAVVALTRARSSREARARPAWV